MYIVDARQTMGQALPSGLRLGQLGGAAISKALATAAAAEPEPFSKAALAIAAFVSSIVGPDPRNVPDTQVTEAMEIALNQIWDDVSGEMLPTSCDPGRCGAEHVAILQVSAYPNVPKGPLGDTNVDIDLRIQQATAIIGQARGQLLNPHSATNPAFTQNPILLLLNRVRQARLNPATSAAAVLALPGSFPTWPLWVGGGLLAAKFLL